MVYEDAQIEKLEKDNKLLSNHLAAEESAKQEVSTALALAKYHAGCAYNAIENGDWEEGERCILKIIGEHKGIVGPPGEPVNLPEQNGALTSL